MSYMLKEAFMIDLEEICRIYFNDKIKPKHLVEFEAVTPKQNFICGYINKKPNEYLGSMYIYSVNGIVSPQFVRSMPKINYTSHDNELESSPDGFYVAYEKLDGSCLIIYPLLLNGKVIEIVPKSRNTPVADDFLLSMFSLVDQNRIYNFFKENMTKTLLFELYGVMNKHDILYPKTYIDIRLIGMTRGDEICKIDEVIHTARQYHFKRPDPLFYLEHHNGKWSLHKGCCDSDLFYYLPEQNERIYYPTQYDCINALAELLQEINENYTNQHNRLGIEGCVINGVEKDTHKQLYIKVKPHDIIQQLRLQNGIPRRFILKEVRKYFDEYGSQVKSLYSEDKNHYLNYVTENLLEEFSESEVITKKTKRKIERVFFDVWEMMTPPQGLQDMCQKLIDEYPDLSTSELMRKFAEEHPEKKSKARLVYSVVKSIKGD